MLERIRPPRGRRAAGLCLGALLGVALLPGAAAVSQPIPSPVPSGPPSARSAQVPPTLPGSGPGSGQTAPGSERAAEEWNSPEALELVERGRRARAETRRHADLESYTARTQGHVYFYVDPDVDAERILLRADQVAVDHYWRAPDESHQVVVGQRTEKKAPIRDFDYFLDRLTLVQYGFGDVIEVGHGSDVSEVPHPLAVNPPTAGPEDPYDYRISDSLRLTLPGAERPLEIRRLDVRPRDPERPGFVGTIDLDRDTGSIVRMAFTVTPAAYRDPRNDRVRVHLEYGLWEGRYWLPHEQRIEVRREIPQLDLGAGTVIKSILRVGDYELGAPVDQVFRSPWSMNRVSFRPEEERRAFDFDEGLLARLEEAGLEGAARAVDPREIRRLAREAGRDRVRSGLPSVRFHLPDLSTGLRYNRAEGWAAGGGATVAPNRSLRARLRGGYAFGDDRVHAGGKARLDRDRRWHLEISAQRREMEDLGVRPGSPGVVNTLTAMTGARDDVDPFLRSSLGLALVRPAEGSGTRLSLGAEFRSDRSARLAREAAPLGGDRAHRPVRPVDEGEGWALTAAAAESRPLGAGWRLRAHLDAEAVRHEGSHYGRLQGEANSSRGAWGGDGELLSRFRFGASVGDVPLQGHALLGGRGTLPGYGYRTMGGAHHAVLDVTLSRELLSPWLSARANVGAGWSGGLPGEAAKRWGVEPSRGVRPTAGVGVGIYRDLVNLDAHRGLRQGRWTLDLYVDPRWWGQL